MTKAAACVLLYLDRFLLANPAEKKNLLSLHQKITGKKLDQKSLWRHTKRKIEPAFGTALVYLIFLATKQHLIVEQKVNGKDMEFPVSPALFAYKNPEWLKK